MGATRIGARVGNADEFDTGKLGIFGGVVAAKSANPDNAGTQYSGLAGRNARQKESPGKYRGL